MVGEEPIYRGIRFKVANESERVTALEQRARIYASELGSRGVDLFDEQADHLVAVDASGDVVAALRIIGPSIRPLEIERYVDLSRFIANDRTPAQIGGFWIRPDQRRITRTSMIHIGMLNLALAFVRDLGVTDLAMYTVRRLATFYGRAGFHPGHPVTFVHPIWGEVCLLHLDLLEASNNARSGPPNRTRGFPGAEIKTQSRT